MLRNDLSALKAWLTETKEPLEGLDGVEDAVQALVLHPDDVALFDALLGDVRAPDPAPTRVARFVGFLADLAVRYDHPYPEDLVSRVAAVRASLTPSRGPAVVGANGAFRRGDLVVREVPAGLQDAVFLEAEPLTPHAREYGRTAAVVVLSQSSQPDVVDRWFLDQIYVGHDYGRPT